MTLFAEVRQTASAKTPLVLLHGFGGSGIVWQPLLDLLDAGRPLILYDLPGHGRSLTAQGLGHAGTMAAVIAADLAARGLQRFHLCGHSLGGAIASLIALRAQAEVASLTLLAPGGFGPAINHAALRAYALATDIDALRLATRAMRGAGPVVNDIDFAALAEARQRPRAEKTLLAVLDAFLVDHDGAIGQGVLPFARFDGFSVPTRLLWGEDDPILPVSQAKAIWPKAEVTIIPSAGHMLIEEAPARVAEVLNDLPDQDPSPIRRSE